MASSKSTYHLFPTQFSFPGDTGRPLCPILQFWLPLAAWPSAGLLQDQVSSAALRPGEAPQRWLGKGQLCMERSAQPAQARGFSTLAGWPSLGLLLFTPEEAMMLLACRNRHLQCWQSRVLPGKGTAALGRCSLGEARVLDPGRWLTSSLPSRGPGSNFPFILSIPRLTGDTNCISHPKP